MTWTAAQCDRFVAGLLRLEGAPSLLVFARWCRAHGRAVPAEADEHARANMLVWLSHRESRERVLSWAAAQPDPTEAP